MTHDDKCPVCKNTNGEHKIDCVYYTTAGRFCDLSELDQELHFALNMNGSKRALAERALADSLKVANGTNYPHVQTGVVISFPVSNFQHKLLQEMVGLELNIDSFNSYMEADDVAFLVNATHIHVDQPCHSFVFPNWVNVEPMIRHMSQLITSYYEKLEQAFSEQYPDAVKEWKKNYDG